MRELASKVRPNLHVREVRSGEQLAADAETMEMELKPRVLDPTVLLEGGGTARLTELDVEYAEKVRSYKASKKGRRTFVLE